MRFCGDPETHSSATSHKIMSCTAVCPVCNKSIWTTRAWNRHQQTCTHNDASIRASRAIVHDAVPMEVDPPAAAVDVEEEHDAAGGPLDDR